VLLFDILFAPFLSNIWLYKIHQFKCVSLLVHTMLRQLTHSLVSCYVFHFKYCLIIIIILYRNINNGIETRSIVRSTNRSRESHIYTQRCNHWFQHPTYPPLPSQFRTFVIYFLYYFHSTGARIRRCTHGGHEFELWLYLHWTSATGCCEAAAS
jgi:hypothetical protein